MSDPKPQVDVRPYAVRDALDAGSLPRVVIQSSPSAAISHVVGARFSADALNAMEVLALAAQGARVEDPRNTLPARLPFVGECSDIVGVADSPQASLLPDVVVASTTAGEVSP